MARPSGNFLVVSGCSEADPVPARPWAELVFHVLAHVSESAPLASSVYDPGYVAFVRQHAGPADGRALGQDARVLGQVLDTHAKLATCQLLAWLFDTPSGAARWVEVDLAELPPEAVRDPALLAPLAGVGAPAEVLRTAALLEREAFDLLPPSRFDRAELERQLERVVDAAPGLLGFRVVPLRALGLRGRVYDDEIWVGVSIDGRPSLEHVAWQAAHEASVAELGGERMGERDRERAAIVLLAERARRAGLADEHARWLAHFAAPLPSSRASDLPPPLQRVVRECLARPASR